MPYEIKDIVKIIKNKRDELNLSLRDLSSKTGISSSTLQRYETMETNMPIDKFQIICDVLGLEADKLLSNKNYSSQEKENNIWYNKPINRWSRKSISRYSKRITKCL